MKKKPQAYFETKWPAILWSVFVFILLVFPAKKLPDEQLLTLPHFDKFVHAAAFCLLVFLWAWYYKKRIDPAQFSKIVLLIAVLATVYGILMEYVQLLAGRDFDLWDMVADGAGALLAAFFAKKISPGRNRGRNQN
jgi:VanZ family protein